MKPGKIYIGADHNGFAMKAKLIDYLSKAGWEVEDTSGKKLDPEDDFPVFASRVVHAMFGSEAKEPRGILICGSGQGMAIAANRFKGVRAVVLDTKKEAWLARNDDDSNVLALPAVRLEHEPALTRDIIETWLSTPFEAVPRRIRRIKQLDELN